MLNDSQTHEIPKTEEGITAIAVLMMISVNELEDSIRFYQNNVIRICDELFSVFSEEVRSTQNSLNEWVVPAGGLEPPRP